MFAEVSVCCFCVFCCLLYLWLISVTTRKVFFCPFFDCEFISLYDNVANLFFLLCHLVVVIYFFELEGGGCAGVLWLTTIYNAEYLLLSLRLSRVDVSAADRVLL